MLESIFREILWKLALWFNQSHAGLFQYSGNDNDDNDNDDCDRFVSRHLPGNSCCMQQVKQSR